MQYAVELAATVVSAVSGALAGRGKQVDLFGVVVLAGATAVGGGTLRDLILDAPIFWLADPWFVVASTAAALGTFVLARFRAPPRRTLLYADAVGLALFTAIGCEKAVVLGAGPVPAIVLGVTTGVAGGILRDVLTGEIPLVFRRTIELYATASLAGAAAFVLLDPYLDAAPLRLLAAGIVLAVRLAAIRFGWRLPLFVAK